MARGSRRERAGQLFEYEIDGRSVLRVTPTAERPGEFAAEVVPYDVHVTRATVRGEINQETSSLFAAMASAGETADLSVELADIFSGEVDFNNDLQPGDRFELLTEKAVRDGRLVGYGQHHRGGARRTTDGTCRRSASSRPVRRPATTTRRDAR